MKLETSDNKLIEINSENVIKTKAYTLIIKPSKIYDTFQTCLLINKKGHEIIFYVDMSCEFGKIYKNGTMFNVKITEPNPVYSQFTKKIILK